MITSNGQSRLMSDGSQPPQEEGVAENVLDAPDMVLTVVRVTMVGDPPYKPRRMPFNSRKAAMDYIASLQPEPNPIGSPKQRLAKRAKLLGVAIEHVNTHTLVTEIETDNEPSTPFADQPTQPEGGSSDLPAELDTSGDPLEDFRDPSDSESDGGDAELRAASGVRPSGGTLVPGGPPQPDLRQLIASRAALSERASSVREDAGEAEDS